MLSKKSNFEGYIEYHGAKQVIVNEYSHIPLDDCGHFINGDKVLITNDNKAVLIERQPQPVIGIVQKIVNNNAILYIVNFGTVCKFVPTVDNNNYIIGDRLILWLHKDGTITIKSKYSNDSKNDVQCLLEMYCLTIKRPDNNEIKQNHLYTIDSVVNHNDLDTFTIDPTNSVDFDDAISVDVKNNTIYIHIVDIAGTDFSEAGYKRLRERCFTLYLSNEHTEHLLDEIDASENLSLIVNKQRNVITVKVVLDEDGLVNTYNIYRSTIIVKNRYDYETVYNQIVDNKASDSIKYLVDLTNKRSSDITYNINLPSIRIKTNNHQVESITVENTNDIAHKLVATSMILANLIVSKHLSSENIILPNRFHESLKGFKMPNFEHTGNESVDSFIIIKRFARAYYSIDKKGHFGLGITDYVHFTSPMRRYADVLVHRLLAGYKYENLQDEVMWINQRSTLVRSIQDIYIDWKIKRWLKNSNQLYTIWITSIAKSGIMWFMPDLSLNGFMHISELEPKQFWSYNINKLVGTTTKKELEVGSKLTVKIKKIDEITGVIGFLLYS